MSEQKTFAIVVGGGPAPGINGVISAATIEAINRGHRVFGIYDGFQWLAKGDTSHAKELRFTTCHESIFRAAQCYAPPAKTRLKTRKKWSKTFVHWFMEQKP